VAQEIQALKLYLEIERTRFEDRLRTRFEIAPEVLTARIPSLLLQPLVENAVNYAVTPLEEGADIWVTARRLGDRLELSVADTGPGVGDSRPNPEGAGQASTNVGLANIRERLQQAYGDDHRFEFLPNTGSPLVQAGVAKGPGVLALIEIPLQLVPAAEAARHDSLAGSSYEVAK
jgi:LytS/YehU family sensor histidine kinase